MLRKPSRRGLPTEYVEAMSLPPAMNGPKRLRCPLYHEGTDRATACTSILVWSTPRRMRSSVASRWETELELYV
jgi:hypothetical protein